MTVTLASLLTDYIPDVAPTADEITAWGTLTQVERTAGGLMSGRLATNANTVTTSVGLFGADLTEFLDACTAAADTEICDVTDYDVYNGWGIGVNWSSSATVTPALVDGIVLATSLWSAQVTWDATANVVKAGKVASVAADAPVAPAAVTAADVADPFNAWGADAQTNADDQFAFSFFEAGDDFYFEAGDTETIWTTFGSVASVSGNVENTDFEFVGAASLTAATSVIVAALLF
jgi:hypothetical protein